MSWGETIHVRARLASDVRQRRVELPPGADRRGGPEEFKRIWDPELKRMLPRDNDAARLTQDAYHFGESKSSLTTSPRTRQPDHRHLERPARTGRRAGPG